MDHNLSFPLGKCVDGRAASVNRLAEILKIEISNLLKNLNCGSSIEIVLKDGGYVRYLFHDELPICKLEQSKDKFYTSLYLGKDFPEYIIAPEKLTELFRLAEEPEVIAPEGVELPKIIKYRLLTGKESTRGNEVKLVVKFDDLRKPSYQVCTDFISQALSTVESSDCCHFSIGSFNEVLKYYPTKEVAQAALERLVKICPLQ